MVKIGAPLGRRVSQDLWGLFLEDINYSLDGGLNADLVRNGDFEATPADSPTWGPLTGWEVSDPAAVRIRSDAPFAPANATYLRLVAGDQQSATASNRGYDESGMFVAPGRYRLHLAARAQEGQPRLRAHLRDHLGETNATTRVPVPADAYEWKWYEADLEVTSAGRRRLELEVEAGTLDVDLIELRPVDPATGTELLFRDDLVEALAELQPAFVRFPGGCLAHGYGLDNIYHWKHTIGPREHRRGMPNTWGYRQSMRIGYHEYFLLCERLGASPMPVVAAGVCCQNVPGGPQAIPQPRMPQYIQDVLDLIEYANGGVDTRWGAVRAAAGHPEPFGMRYLGLGNEDVVNDQFEDRFSQIFDVVQAAHPEVTVIGTLGPKPYGPDYDNGWSVARRHGVQMVDEHSYRTPRWLLQNVDRFEGYDRSGPAVYLGEWAARTSSVRSAVAEAAYMIGIERNSDIVKLASYAPLLARVGSTQWVPDLIYFTDEEVLPSANYHAAWMLARHRGDEVLGCRVEGGGERAQPRPSMREIELRSKGSTTRFAAIVVDGEPRAEATTAPDGGVARVAGVIADGRAVEMRLTATREGGSEGFIVGFGDPESGTMHEWRVGEWRNRGLTLSRRDDDITDEVDGPHRFEGVQTGVDTDIRIRIDGARIQAWLDDQLIHDHNDDQRPAPELVVGATRRGNETLVTVVAPSDAPRQIQITGEGITSGVRALTTTLAGAEPEAGAPFTTSPVTPRAGEITAADDCLEFVAPPWSVTTLTIAPPTSSCGSVP